MALGATIYTFDIELADSDRAVYQTLDLRVAVYTHKDPAQWVGKLEDAKIHRAEKLEVFALEREWLAQLVARLERRMKFSLARSEGELYLTTGEMTSQTVLGRPWR